MVLLLDFSPPTEGVHFQQTNTSVDINGSNLGNGTLFITESYVGWQKSEDGKGFSLQYPAISCHAISRDLNAFSRECLYLMIDGKLPGDESSSEDEDEQDDDSDADLTEIRFIPDDKNMLEPMFAAMSDCQALHPDPEDVDSEDEGYDQYDQYEQQQQQQQQQEEEEEEEEEDAAQGVVFPNTNGAGAMTSETQEPLSHFASVLHLGQGDGPGPSGAPQAVMSASGDAEEVDDEEGMDVGQFEDADAME